MRRVLIVDDDPTMIKLIERILESNNYETIAALDGESALEKMSNDTLDACLLDMMLPDINGIQLLQKIRKMEEGKHIPIIMITGVQDEFDTILGLELGADDFIHKPFNKRELIARLNVIFRRIEQDEEKFMKPISFGGIRLNPYTHEVTREGEIVELSPKEYKLLLFLVTNPNVVFTRDQLLNHIWDDEVAIETRTVDVHIRKLRKKFEEIPEKPKWFETVRGYGYRFLK